MGKGVVGSTYGIQCKTLTTTVCVVCNGRSSALIDGAGGGVLTEDCWWWVGVCDCWAAGSVGGHKSPWVNGCGGRARSWCWGLDMQATCVVLGIHGCPGGRTSP